MQADWALRKVTPASPQSRGCCGGRGAARTAGKGRSPHPALTRALTVPEGHHCVGWSGERGAQGVLHPCKRSACSRHPHRTLHREPAGSGHTHVQDFLPEPSGLHAADQAQQQVHERRSADVLQHQAHKPVLLPQERRHLEPSSPMSQRAGLATARRRPKSSRGKG